jgi:hypothetical protein
MFIASVAVLGHFRVGALKRVQAADQSQNCLDLSVAQRITNEFQFDFESFGSSRAMLPQEICNPESKIRKLIESYQLLVNGQFKPYNTGVIKESYYNFIKRLSPSVGMDLNQTCGKSPLYAACHEMGRSAKMLVTNHFFDFPAVDRANFIVHESHHGTGSSHVTCTRGPKKGVEQGCDSNFQTRGAYAADIEYSARVYLIGKNFDPVTQAVARSMAIFGLEGDFNEVPQLKDQQALMLLDAKRENLIQWDGRNAPKSVPIRYAPKRIVFLMEKTKDRGQSFNNTILYLLSTEQAQAIDLAKSFEADNVLTGALAFRLFSMFGIGQDNITSLIDFMSIEDRSYYLFSSGVAARGVTPGSPYVTINAPSGVRLTRFLESSPCGETGAFVVAFPTTPPEPPRRGKYTPPSAPAPLKPVLLTITQDSMQPSQCQWPQSFKTVGQLNGKVYALDANGTLYTWNQSTRELIRVPEFSGQSFTEMRSVVLSREAIMALGQ